MTGRATAKTEGGAPEGAALLLCRADLAGSVANGPLTRVSSMGPASAETYA